MKSGTPSHIKTKKLKMLLKLPLWQVVGILESLWHFAGDCADDGGVGRYSNEDIAAYMEWERDPEELVDALVHCRWLDPHPVHRLVVHDWDEERPYYIEERIRKREQRLASKKPGTRPEESGTVPGRGQENGGQSDQTKPNQTKAKQTKPRQSKEISVRAAVAAGDVRVPPELDVPEVRDAVERWLRHKQQIGKPYKSAETASMMFGDFVRAGPAAFVAAVNHSIGQNYQGIYSPSGSKNGTGKPSPGKWYDPNAIGVGDI